MNSTDLTIPQEASFLNSWSAYKALTKPRLSLMSVLTAVGGYWISDPIVSWQVLLSLVVGTSLAAGGASALNQYLERDLDRLMDRTRGRPLPLGMIDPKNALWFGLLLSGFGIGILYLGVHFLAAALTFLTVFSYAWMYTPLKKHTLWCTHFGAIPGALPILMGASAAGREIHPLGWILFGVLAVWQMPHFMAIAWLYRKDYARAGMPMVTVVDPSGRRAGLEAILFSLALIILGVLPWPLGFMGPLYGVSALMGGVWMLNASYQFAKNPAGEGIARWLFLASVIYLPLYLLIAVLDRCFL